MYSDFKLANYNNALLSPELYARQLSRLYTGDVIDGLTVAPGTGLQVVLAPGNALVRYGSGAVASAREVSLVANFNLTIGTADVSNPRIDLVVLYIDNAVSLPGGTPTSANLDGPGVAKAKIVQGTAASSPVAPNATAIQSSVGAGNPYTVLAQVRVDAGVSVVAAGKITDVRSMVYITSKVTSSNIDWTTLGALTAWTPTLAGFSLNPSGLYYYSKVGSQVTLYVSQTTNGTSNSNIFSMTLPFPSANVVTGMQWENTSQVVDNGVSLIGTAIVLNNSNLLNFYKDAGGNAFTASGSKRTLGMQITYTAA